MHASQETSNQERENLIIKLLPCREVNKPPQKREVNNEESEGSDDEWEEIDPDEELVDEAAKSLTDVNVMSGPCDDDMEMEDEDEDEDDFEVHDPSCCFMRDLHHNTRETCMIHMHKQHGFFIPDVECLKDPGGLLTCVGLKVKRDFVCLYCNDRCQPFNSLEAVRRHMEAKGHCRVHYGDGDGDGDDDDDDDDDEVELEEFYDYSSSYMDEDG